MIRKTKSKGDSATRWSLGRYIVADPRICHGKLTFRGTRVFVADVLDQVAEGMDWESISESWNGGVSRQAITEAVQLASEALLRHADEFRLGRAGK
jgi:uncharacterized protein (DUF433 family)